MRVVSVSAARGVALAALLVAGLLVAGCTAQSAAHRAVSSRHAAATRTAVHTEPVVVIPNLTYSFEDGEPLRLDICMPHPSGSAPLSFRPAIVVIHGGSWMVGDKAEAPWRNTCEWLASAGYVAADVDYRLAPKYRYPDEINDVEHAVDWLRAPSQVSRFGIDKTLVGAFGGSAGGNLAALLGTTGSGSLSVGHRVAAVAELSGPVDLTAKGAETPLIRGRELSYLGCRTFSECPQDLTASPVDNVDPSDPPFFIGHSQDELIPLSQSQNFATRLKAEHVPVTLVVMPGTNHSISMLTPVLRGQIIAFFRSTLAHHAPAKATS
jgi:acetyl esterase